MTSTYALGDICACPIGRGARHFWHPFVCPVSGPFVPDTDEDEPAT